MKNIPFLLQLRSYNPILLGAGAFLLAAGLFGAFIVNSATWWNLTLVALGIVVFVLFLAANLTEVKEVGKKRSTLVRANLTLVSIVTVVIVCALYYIVSRHPVRFDMTANKFYTLSDQTLDVLSKLPQEVDVTLFTSAKRKSAEIARAETLLQEYALHSSKFHFKTVDIDKDPTEAKRLDIHEYNTVVFESGDNRKDVLQRDYVTYALQGRQPVPKFQGEGAFTSALMSMTDTKKVSIYFTVGHGEKDINDPQPDGFNICKGLIGQQNYNVSTLDLVKTGKIPDDATIVAIVGPARPFQPAEEDLLSKYLAAGGKLLLCVDPFVKTGLDGLLKDYGVKLGNDLAVDSTKYAFPDVRAVIPDYGNSPIVEKLSSQNIYTIMAFSRSVEKVDPTLKNVTQSVFLQTTDKGWGVGNPKEKKLAFHPGVDTKGPVPLAMTCERTPDGATDPNVKTRLVVFGSSSFLENSLVQQFGDSDLALNSLDWLAMQENKIDIHPKEEDDRVLNLTSTSVNFIFALTVCIMPLATLVLGGIIWYRRRSL